jgi:hypothetical protein
MRPVNSSGTNTIGDANLTEAGRSISAGNRPIADSILITDDPNRSRAQSRLQRPAKSAKGILIADNSRYPIAHQRAYVFSLIASLRDGRMAGHQQR